MNRSVCFAADSGPRQRISWRRLWTLLLATGLSLFPSAQAHMRGLYATKAEAEQRAAALKCKGTFALGGLWMPCANERALHDALQKAP